VSRTPPPKLSPLSLTQLMAIEDEDERERVVAMRKRAIFNISSMCVKCIEHFTPPSHKGEKLFVFTVGATGEEVHYNVDRAYAIAERDKLPVEWISRADAIRALGNTDVDSTHMRHIPPEAIARPIMFAKIPGTGTETIIDGSHRLAICLMLNLRILTYVLDEKQSAEALFSPEDWAKGVQVLRNLGITIN